MSFSAVKALFFVALTLIAFSQLALAASLPAPYCVASSPVNPELLVAYIKEKPFKYETFYRNPRNPQAYVHITKDFARHESIRRIASNLTPKTRHMAVEFLAKNGTQSTQYLQLAPQTVCSIDSSHEDGKVVAVHRWTEQAVQQPCEP